MPVFKKKVRNHACVIKNSICTIYGRGNFSNRVFSARAEDERQKRPFSVHNILDCSESNFVFPVETLLSLFSLYLTLLRIARSFHFLTC